jgi:RHS repeat-associated protein
LTTCSRADGGAGSNYPFLTRKERDNETGLDYFGARYYASVQGRFTGADPYDINFERQETVDQEEADALFADYIDQPQHWNRYSYALNNPLRYIDPDGRKDEEYTVRLLGKDIRVKISDKIDKTERAAIKKQLNAAVEKINAGADKLTSDQKKAINSMNGIEVRNDVSFSFMNTNNGVFNMTPRRAWNPNLDVLAADIIHDSFHKDQSNRGLSFEGKENYLAREREASAFALGVAERIGLSSEVHDRLKADSVTGHLEQRSSPYIKTPKKKIP